MKSVMTTKDLLLSLELTADEMQPTPRLRKRFKKKLRKIYNQGRLSFSWTWDNAEHAYEICVAELIRGRYHWTGWECRSNENRLISTQEFHLPRWQGQRCKLLVIAEQGLGDEILFASCFPDLLKDCPEATIECDPRLLPIFERSFDAEFISRRVQSTMADTRQKQWGDYEGLTNQYDAFVLAGELPKIYRRSKESFPGTPYLIPPSGFNTTKHPTYGISWKGRQGEIDPIDLMVFKANYIDLQYGRHPLPPNVAYLSIDTTNDIDAVFGLTATLDGIITIPNTLAHVGGSLGVRTYVVRPQAVYRGDREDDPSFHNRLRFEFGLFNGRIPWYNSVRTYPSLAAFRGQHL